MPTTETHYVLVVKQDCPTCALVEPVIAELESAGHSLEVWSQDNPDFPSCSSPVGDDRELGQSWQLKIETVPTVIRMQADTEIDRTVGWDRTEWLRLFEM